MIEKKYKINEGLEIVNKSKEFEKQGLNDRAAIEYKKARDFFKNINEYKLYAQCLVAHSANVIKYYLAGRDIEDFSGNMIDFYIQKIDGIKGLELNKFDRYTILINAYQELEKIFEDANMVDYREKMFYKKKRFYHKIYWQKAMQKKIDLKSRIKDISNSFFHRYFDSFCSHGESPFKVCIWIITTIIVFSVIFKFFNLIEFEDSEKTLCFWQSLYFSVVTFSTLGYGDIVPKGPIGQFWVSIEVLLGYIMLGTLIALFINKIKK